MRLPLLVPQAILKCAHGTGVVQNVHSQEYVRIAGNPVLIEPDPQGRTIAGCNNVNPLTGIFPCLLTLGVDQGYSDLLRVDGKRACLQTVRGGTSGTPVGTHEYWVRSPGQALVAQSS